MVNAVVVDENSSDCSRAEALAKRLNLPLHIGFSNTPVGCAHQGEFVLSYTDEGLKLVPTGKGASGPVWCDFVGGAVAHRRQFGGGKGQMIAKAVGVGKRPELSVLDATAGMGRDAFVLATLGCRVTLRERHVIVSELLADGLLRAKRSGDAAVEDIAARMTLDPRDSLGVLSDDAPLSSVDVVYLDPMFPVRRKSAKVKKEMLAFHQLVGADEDSDQLLPLALQQAKYRVVVKRSKPAPFLNQMKPTYQLLGKSSRFDIYVNASFDSAER